MTGTGSCVLEAVAGAGKTTVLLEAGARMRGQVAYVVYNKKNAAEAKEKLKALLIDWKKMEAATVHSFGKRALVKSFPHLKDTDPDPHKVERILESLIPGDDALAQHIAAIAKLVSLAKGQALGIIGSIRDEARWWEIINHYEVWDESFPDPDRGVRLAIEALERSNADTHSIDFDDMIYLSVLLKCRFWRYDVVMVDEAQDTNPARRAVVRAMLNRGGRVIAVGDRHQAIYGFTGADNDALDLIAKDFGCVRLPLTVSYRCPTSVVAFARQWVNHIEATPTAPVGSVSSMSMAAFIESARTMNGEDAVLCRVTKQLVTLAFKLIRQKIACKIEGRDVGRNLIKLARRWKLKSLAQLDAKLTDYLHRETTKLLAAKKETALQQIEDMVEALKEIIDQCRLEQKHSIEELVTVIEGIFADDVSGILTLSTIHKSKGREWERVYWLDRLGTCPSKWARQEWQQEQEINLMYVAATRAKAHLIELAPDPATRKPRGEKPEDIEN